MDVVSIDAKISTRRYFAEEFAIGSFLYTKRLFFYDVSTNAGPGPWYNLLTSCHASKCVYPIG